MREETRSRWDDSWMADAKCRNPAYDKSWWFPETGGQPKTVEKAKAICKLCPVRWSCLRYATANDEIGIWGGLTGPQRRSYASVIKHKRLLVCAWCKHEFAVPTENVARHIYCSRACRNDSSRGNLSRP